MVTLLIHRFTVSYRTGVPATSVHNYNPTLKGENVSLIPYTVKKSRMLWCFKFHLYRTLYLNTAFLAKQDGKSCQISKPKYIGCRTRNVFEVMIKNPRL